MIQGGTQIGSISPALSAQLTINGVTFDIGGAGYGYIASTIDAGSSSQTHRADDDFNDNVIYGENILVTSIDATPGAIPLSIDQAYIYTISGNETGQGSFQLLSEQANVPAVEYVHYAYGDLAPTSVTEAILEDGPGIHPIPVPESATWALMFVGFGALGVRLRERRRGVSLI